MFGRGKSVTQNPVVAEHMNAFFDGLGPQGAGRLPPRSVAEAYGTHLFHKRRRQLVDDKRFSRSHFHIGLGVGEGDFTQITKRSSLVSDTLLLSHNGAGDYHRLTAIQDKLPRGVTLDEATGDVRMHAAYLSMRCPDIEALGRWVRDAEPLLRAGLAWYLPNYSIMEGDYGSDRFVRYESSKGGRPRFVRRMPSRRYEAEQQKSFPVKDVPTVLDFMVKNGRAVDESAAQPVKSKLVHPILTMDLPFIDGISLRDFGEITVHEFASYSGFRSFLRQAFLELDDALHAVQSESQLAKIGEQIGDGIRGVQAQMTATRRRKALAVTGAGIGTVGATLVAVSGPALNEALAILGTMGAGSGLWAIIKSVAENSPRTLRQDKWYYVWVLAKKANLYGL